MRGYRFSLQGLFGVITFLAGAHLHNCRAAAKIR